MTPSASDSARQRGRDSNPRLTSLPATAFKAVPIGHSGTPPESGRRPARTIVPSAAGRKTPYWSTARMSPSWTTSPSWTRSSVRVPSSSVRTGISIFIDSRMRTVSPAASLSPSAATTRQTLATISATISPAMTLPRIWGPPRRGPGANARTLAQRLGTAGLWTHQFLLLAAVPGSPAAAGEQHIDPEQQSEQQSENGGVEQRQRRVLGLDRGGGEAGGDRSRAERGEGAHPPTLSAAGPGADAPDEYGEADQHLDRTRHAAESVPHPPDRVVDPVDQGLRAVLAQEPAVDQQHRDEYGATDDQYEAAPADAVQSGAELPDQPDRDQQAETEDHDVEAIGGDRRVESGHRERGTDRDQQRDDELTDDLRRRGRGPSREDGEDSAQDRDQHRRGREQRPILGDQDSRGEHEGQQRPEHHPTTAAPGQSGGEQDEERGRTGLAQPLRRLDDDDDRGRRGRRGSEPGDQPQRHRGAPQGDRDESAPRLDGLETRRTHGDPTGGSPAAGVGQRFDRPSLRSVRHRYSGLHARGGRVAPTPARGRIHWRLTFRNGSV